MRSDRPLLALLLAVAVVAAQWLAAAHEPDHAMQPGAAHCAVCVYAHGAGAGALPAVPHVVVATAAVAPERPAVANPLAAFLKHHPIRGPPTDLA